MSRIYFSENLNFSEEVTQTLLQKAREHRLHLCIVADNPPLHQSNSTEHEFKNLFVVTYEVITPYLVQTSNGQNETLLLLPKKQRWAGEFDIAANLPLHLTEKFQHAYPACQLEFI